jgi:hypothetical protein
MHLKTAPSYLHLQPLRSKPTSCMGLPMEDLAFQPKAYNSFENKSVQLLNRYIQLSQFCQKPSCAGWLDTPTFSWQLTEMKQKNAIAKLTWVLSCLVVAFALAFSPPAAAHAAAGVRDGNSAMEQGRASSLQDVGSHSAVQTHCGSSKADTSSHDTGQNQCCTGICLSAMLTEAFVSPQADASVIGNVIQHVLPVAAETTGFLRPPKHLI